MLSNGTVKSIRQPRVVVLGSAYAGLATALNLLRICDGKPLDEGIGGRGGGAGRGRGQGRGGLQILSRGAPASFQLPTPQIMPLVTVLDERDGFFHTVGAPLAHASRDYVPTAWRRYSDISELKRENVSILQGSVVNVDPASKIVTYSNGADLRTISYDYLVVATGLRRSWPTVPRANSRETYIQDAEKQISLIGQSNDIVVVGGGAVGIEMAAEIKHCYSSKTVHLIHSRKELLSSEYLPSEFKSKVLDLLRQEGVNVILENRVLNEFKKATKNREVSEVELTNGQRMTADTVIWAASTAVPATNFLPKEVLNEKGFVKTSPTAQFAASVPNAFSHFAVGDIVATRGIRLAAGAIQSGKVAAINLSQMLVGAENGFSCQEVSQRLTTVRPAGNGIKLVMGKTAVRYAGEEGDIAWGEELKQRIFGDDMALHRAYRGLGLPYHL